MPSRETLTRNAEALRVSQPGLADGLLEVPDEVLARFEPIQIPDASEERIGDFANHAKALGAMDALVLLGLGTPKMMIALRQALPAHIALIVMEPSLELAIRMLSHVDMAELFSAAYTSLVMAADDHDIQHQIENLVAKWGLSEMQMVLNPMRSLGEEIPPLSVNLLKNGIENVRVAAANVSHFGNQIIDNIAVNLDAVSGSPDLDAVASCLNGLPVVIVGAGPSLDQQISALRACSNNVVIVAVDAAVKALKDAEIPIDVAVSLDVIGVKSAFLEYLDAETILVSLLGAHPDLVSRQAPRTAFVSDEHPLSHWCASVLGLPLFPSMGNVAHLALLMATGMGAGGVLLVGVDYALSRTGQLYANCSGRGRETLTPELEARVVDGLAFDGQPVKTLPNMIAYSNTLATFARPSQGHIYNVSPEALAVGGIQVSPLEEFLAKHAQGAVSRPIADQVLRCIPEERIALLRSELGPLESELRAFAADASTFATDTDTARTKVASGELSPSEAIMSLSEGAGLFARHRGVIDMVEPLQPAVSFEIAKLTREMSSIKDPVERAQRQLFTLSGPAASGANIAETIADRLSQAGQRMRS